uniref:NB-ARC domain-containing protein n=1 Tax=Lactuca sativa TaxID=4236 RepID=A0A9R1VRM3_LACSA|nr:hypothetical protein LSAT_V11C400172090 [Lactuca sativa]
MVVWHETEAIKKIGEEISLKLRSIHLSNDENLIGMDRRMQELESSLGIGLNDKARMIGIKAMGGIGKTTLARSIFNKVSSLFEDDVDNPKQLEVLAGDWFKDRSRIIIKTRDEKVMLAHGLNAKWIHDVDFLSDEEAMRLFSRYAFKRYIPDQGFEKLSSKVVRYSAGLPLTIKVLCSHLCSEEVVVWIDALKRLETIPSLETLEVFQISYDGLEDDLKEIFLDVACFMGTEASTCTGLELELTEVSPEIIIKGLGNLMKPRYLFLTGSDDDRFPSDWKFDQEIQCFPNSLQLLKWNGYPSHFNFLTAESCNFGKAEKESFCSFCILLVLKKLRFLDISCSKVRTLDFGMTPNLERLELRGCHDISLKELHVPCSHIRTWFGMWN